MYREIPTTDVNYPGFHLPDNMYPTDYLCFEIHVPNDRWHIAAFLGVLHDLTNWFNWQRDEAKQGTVAATVWRNILWQLKPKDCNPKVFPGIEQEDFMPLRIDCDCNVFVTCCDGTEKQILTADQVKALINSPGPGAPQPQPGGGCQEYTTVIQAAQAQIVPTVMNTGDTIELLSATGSSSGDFVVWSCADGEIFFGGACIGGGIFNGSNYVPSAKQGKPVLLINGTYYDLTVGTPFTLPSGISNQTPMLILNYHPTASVSGTITCQVKVCNNQTPPPPVTVTLSPHSDPYACGGLAVFSMNPVAVGDVFTVTESGASGDGRYGACFRTSAACTLQVVSLTGFTVDGLSAWGWAGGSSASGAPPIGLTGTGITGMDSSSPTSYAISYKVLSIP